MCFGIVWHLPYGLCVFVCMCVCVAGSSRTVPCCSRLSTQRRLMALSAPDYLCPDPWWRTEGTQFLCILYIAPGWETFHLTLTADSDLLLPQWFLSVCFNITAHCVSSWTLKEVLHSFRYCRGSATKRPLKPARQKLLCNFQGNKGNEIQLVKQNQDFPSGVWSDFTVAKKER